MASGDPFVDTLVLRGCWDVDREAGLDGILEFVDNDLRPRVLFLFDEEGEERVGDVMFVPSETRGGRESLLPGAPSAAGRPMGVGVEYIYSSMPSRRRVVLAPGINGYDPS